VRSIFIIQPPMLAMACWHLFLSLHLTNDNVAQFLVRFKLKGMQLTFVSHSNSIFNAL